MGYECMPPLQVGQAEGAGSNMVSQPELSTNLGGSTDARVEVEYPAEEMEAGNPTWGGGAYPTVVLALPAVPELVDFD